jgi:hypothetical protein
MARLSQWAKYKSRVFEAFRGGATPRDAIAAYGIPRSTAYDWLNEYRRTALGSESVRNSGSNHSLAEVVDSPPHLFVVGGTANIESENVSDFALARRTLQEIAKDKSESGAVRVQAAFGLMRLCAMRAELPRHVLEEKEEISVASERKKLESMSAEELARLYKELIASQGK